MSETKSIKDMYSNDKAGQILTLALEIEGLALLIQRRGDLVNPEVNCILHDKASALLELIKVIAGSHESVEAVAAADSAPVVSCVESVGSKEQYPESEPMEKKDVETAVESEPLAGNIGRDDVHASGSVSSDDMAVADSAIAEEVADSSDSMVEDRQADRHVAEPDAVSVTSASTPVAGHPVFTLNDRFRFIRELFKGSSQDFNDTLRLVSSMSSADEVIEYLSDYLCLDPENPDVVDFTAIVTQRFH